MADSFTFTAFRVRIEFQRVQTFLFAVPKLRTMLGANALLGEVLRRELPRLALECDSGLPAGVDVPKTLQGSDATDPLHGAPSLAAASPGGRTLPLEDDPRALYRLGILARDGGHFSAVFPEIGPARRFEELAGEMINALLPGLLFEIKVEQWKPAEDAAKRKFVWHPWDWSEVPGERKAGDHILFDLPILQVCEFSGRGPAQTTVKDPDRDDQDRDEPQVRYAGAIAQALLDAGSRFRKNESESESDQSPTDDIVGLLTRAKPGYTVRWEEDGAEKEYVDVCPLPLHGDPNAFIAPRDFDRLARDGSYMAVIHADGNMVGDRQRALNSESKSKADTPVPVHAEAAFKLWFEAETKVECFFHCMRKAVRQALCEALWRTFNPKKQDHGYFPGPLESGKPRARPYQLMMLGGDDLLLVCRARNALDFVRHYARALARRPLDGGMPLGIGAGVVISQPSLPFHRLHHLADALAGSAKRLVRGLREYWAADKGLEVARFSAVDWMVCTNAWADDPAQARAVDRLRFEIVGSPPLDLALSCKPYWVLDEGAEVFGKAAAAGAKLWSLDRLRGGADKLQRKLKRGDAARSQLKSLPGAMRAGFHAGLLAFEDLPGETREGLNAAGIGETPWLNASGKPMAMQDQGDSLALTRVLDLVEVFEIVRLGRRAERPRTQSERRTGSDAVRENAQ